MNTSVTIPSLRSALRRRRRVRPGLSIRTKLLLVALALLSIPWMGYKSVREMENFLLTGQEEALLLAASGIATVLNDRAELFNPEVGVPEVLGSTYDLYARQLFGGISLDGDLTDWGQATDFFKEYTGGSFFECTPEFNPDSLSVLHLLGYRGRSFYALFEVTDDTIVYRDRDSRALDHSDQLRLTLQTPAGRVDRYLLITRKSGPMSVYLMDEEWRYPLTGEAEREIAAVFQETETGYVVEVRIPRYLIGSSTRVGFSVVDVDDPSSREIRESVSTSPNVSEFGLGRVLLHSPELERILGGLNRPLARIWILDKEQRVRAVVGTLSQDDYKPTGETESVDDSFWGGMRQAGQNFMDWMFRSPEGDFEDISAEISHRPDAIFTRALAGSPQSSRRRTLDRRAKVIMAAYPIWVADEVAGAVVVEQSSAAVLSLQHDTLRRFTALSLGVFIFLTAVILVFASRLTFRITRLKTATELAITPEGRLRKDHISSGARSADEIGDLTRSISGMLEKLGQYTRYLEGMPDTLAHEMNNPLNVVNSSLENLESHNPDLRDNKYLNRARNGINRLRSILTSLTEAANLEEALKGESREEFDFVDLVNGCVEGYQLSHPDRRIVIEVVARPLPVKGTPDRLAQMLDKLVDNAIHFGRPDGHIIVRLRRIGNEAILSVLNEGSQLPDGMGARLFDPMVTVGTKNAQRSHLGLGLFIVRVIAEFHGGRVTASNLKASDGVEILVSLPLSSPTVRSGSGF